MEARLAHPAFAPLRPWLDRLREPLRAGLDELNAFASERDLRVASGRPLRFVAPSGEAARYGEYELRVFETGGVETRPGSLHDFFNALAWLAFPRTKGKLNALHVAALPGEQGRRGRFRDLLTILDEGGAIVQCADPALEALALGFEWKALFWERRAQLGAGFRVSLLGHAAHEQALAPRPGITCKAIFVAAQGDPDALTCDWLGRLPGSATPRDLPPLPVFGLPDWLPGSDCAEFYDDTRYFRPGRALPSGKNLDQSMPS